MPVSFAALCALAGDRLAMATRSALAAFANAGNSRSLILATPRMPQRSLVIMLGSFAMHHEGHEEHEEVRSVHFFVSFVSFVVDLFLRYDDGRPTCALVQCGNFIGHERLPNGFEPT